MKYKDLLFLLLPFFVWLPLNQTLADKSLRDSDPSLKVFMDSLELYRSQDKVVYRTAIDELLEKSAENEFYHGLGLAEKGFYYFIKAQYDSSFHYLNNAKFIASEINSDELFLSIYILESLVQMEVNNYFEAKENCKKIISLSSKLELELGLELGFEEDKKTGYHHLARIYQRCKLYDKAIENFELSRPSKELGSGPTEVQGWWYLNMGELQVAVENIPLAKTYFQNSLEIWDTLNMNRGKGYSYYYLAECFKKEELSKCVPNYYKAIEFSSLVGNTLQIVESYIGLGSYYDMLSEQEKAASFYTKALDLGLKIQLKSVLIPALDFFIQKPHFQPSVPFSISEILNLRILAGEEAYRRSSEEGLRISKALERETTAKQKAQLANQKSDYLKRIILLFGLFVFSTIIYLLVVGGKNKKLKASKNKINEQYALIKEQSEKLQQANEKLKENNSMLEQSLSVNSLELGHSKELISNLKKATQGQKKGAIESLLRSQVKDSYFEQIKYVNQYTNQKFINDLSSSYSNLTFKEIELCCLLKNGLSSKEIASITLKSVPSIKVARSRIRKKLNIPKATDISVFLNNLYHTIEKVT